MEYSNSASVFPFDQIDDTFLLSSLPNLHQQQTIQQEDGLLVAATFLHDHGFSLTENSRRRKSSSISCADNDDKFLEHKRKKMKHRDVERERRQEMSKLHRSLRSLLPVEYLKGKRSMSDHMHEAVKHIRHLKKKIEELKGKRNELKMEGWFCERPAVSVEFVPTDISHQQQTLTARICWSGIEIMLNTRVNGGIPLSRLLNAMGR